VIKLPSWATVEAGQQAYQQLKDYLAHSHIYAVDCVQFALVMCLFIVASIVYVEHRTAIRETFRKIFGLGCVSKFVEKARVRKPRRVN
jgi:adenosyl cobinamide kinase/adenosyl cobinamide phosphate guanylyltransferase